MTAPDAAAVRLLYKELLDAWNARSAARMAAAFEDEGNVVGFDGSLIEAGARDDAARYNGASKRHGARG